MIMIKNQIAPLRTHNHLSLRKIWNLRLRTRQTNGSTWVRARLLGHNPNLGLSPTPLYFQKFQTIAIVWNARFFPRVDVSTILLGPGFRFWLSSWNQWLEGPTMYQNGSGDCVWMNVEHLGWIPCQYLGLLERRYPWPVHDWRQCPIHFYQRKDKILKYSGTPPFCSRKLLNYW